MPLLPPDQTQLPQLHLYTTLVRTHLGPLALAIVLALLSHGLLGARDIAARTGASAAVTKRLLVLLLQLQCVQFWVERGRTVYLVAPDGVHKLLYGGEIVAEMRAIYGDVGAEVVQNVLQMGHVRVADYVSGSENAVELEHMFVRLVQDGFLVPWRTVDCQPVGRVWARLLAETRQLIPALTTTLEAKRTAEATALAKKALVSEVLVRPGVVVKDKVLGQRVQPGTPLSFSLARFHRRLRSQLLVLLARQRVGAVLAQVYAAVLAKVELRLPEPTHPFESIKGLLNDPADLEAFKFSRADEERVPECRVTARELLGRLPESVVLANTVVDAKRGAGGDGGAAAKRVKLEHGVAIPVDLVADADDDYVVDDAPHSPSLVQAHLQILALANTPFLDEVSPGHYVVPFHRVVPCLRQFTYDALVELVLEGQNPICGRVLRCVRENRLLDEKTLCLMALVKERDLRAAVMPLAKWNVLEVQEVARSVDRAASRAVYLYRHRPERLRAMFANSLLSSMARMLALVEEEKGNNAILLNKVARADVAGREEELLLALELADLRQLQELELRAVALVSRAHRLYDILQ